MPFLIDGHNLISYLPDIDLSDEHDEAELVYKLRGFAARTRKKCIVIFDEGLPGGTSQLTTHSVHVVFASSKRTNADRIIMERIGDIRDAANWTVVSSDNEVLSFAKQAGMRPMKCVQFADLLTREKTQRPHKGLQENPMVSAGEIDEFMDLFGIDDVDELEADSPIRQALQDAPQKTDNPAPKSPTIQPTPPKKSKQPAPDDVDAWLSVFGDEPAKQPSEKSRYQRKPKTPPPPARKSDPIVDPRMGESQDVYLSDNSVDAWLSVFGEDERRDATDPAPQRSDPKKQGRYRNEKGERQPTVHKRMSTSDDIFLSDGEVDAWLDVFGVDDEDD